MSEFDPRVDPAIVTTTDPHGNVLGCSGCDPDSYVLVAGPLTDVSFQHYPTTGTTQITVKKRREE